MWMHLRLGLLTLALKRLQELVSPLCPRAVHFEHSDGHNHNDQRSYERENTCGTLSSRSCSPGSP